jgi:hypothetical protein
MLFLLGFSEDLPILKILKKENNKSQCLKSSAVEYRTRKGVGGGYKVVTPLPSRKMRL